VSIPKETTQKMEAVKQALYDSTGVAFVAVDHGAVTSFYSSAPFLTGATAEQKESFFKRVYAGVKDQIDRLGLTGYNEYPADPTSYYGAVALGSKKEAFCFEFRLPFDHVHEYPAEMLAQMAKGVGEVVEPDARLAKEMLLKMKVPRTVHADLQQFLGRFRSGPEFSPN
jgi:hypothetical protein